MPTWKTTNPTTRLQELSFGSEAQRRGGRGVWVGVRQQPAVAAFTLGVNAEINGNVVIQTSELNCIVVVESLVSSDMALLGTFVSHFPEGWGPAAVMSQQGFCLSFRILRNFCLTGGHVCLHLRQMDWFILLKTNYSHLFLMNFVEACTEASTLWSLLCRIFKTYIVIFVFSHHKKETFLNF